MPPYLFEFTWHDAPERCVRPEWIEPATNGLVRFDLVEQGADQTLLTLTQYVPQASHIGAAAGWHHIVETLAQYLERGEATAVAGRFDELQALYEADR